MALLTVRSHRDLKLPLHLQHKEVQDVCCQCFFASVSWKLHLPLHAHQWIWITKSSRLYVKYILPAFLENYKIQKYKKNPCAARISSCNPFILIPQQLVPATKALANFLHMESTNTEFTTRICQSFLLSKLLTCFNEWM